ncbi:MAG: twin-arginine translocation signal domain-containing protein, partial [Phycisphaerae bacterium]
MRKPSLTRRSFIKKASTGLAGAALAATGTSSLCANLVKKADKLAILGGNPVRNKPFPSTWPI